MRRTRASAILYATVDNYIRETDMRDFGNGWSGLKEFAVSRGVASVDDNDDVVAEKIKSVIQGTLPEEEEEGGEVSSDTESETEA